jgi:excisionase family DNA binding protein
MNQEVRNYTRKEAAERWRVSVDTVIRWQKTKKITAFKVGKKWLINEDEVRRIEKGE